MLFPKLCKMVLNMITDERNYSSEYPCKHQLKLKFQSFRSFSLKALLPGISFQPKLIKNIFNHSAFIVIGYLLWIKVPFWFNFLLSFWGYFEKAAFILDKKLNWLHRKRSNEYSELFTKLFGLEYQCGRGSWCFSLIIHCKGVST